MTTKRGQAQGVHMLNQLEHSLPGFVHICPFECLISPSLMTANNWAVLLLVCVYLVCLPTNDKIVFCDKTEGEIQFFITLKHLQATMSV